MKIYAHTVEPDEHLQDTLRTKEIIDQFVGTGYWVKCWIDRLNARWNDGTWHKVVNGCSEPLWVQFNGIQGSFYEIHYLYSDSIFYERDRAIISESLVGIVELDFIHVVEPLSLMTDDDMFDPDIPEDDE